MIVSCAQSLASAKTPSLSPPLAIFKGPSEMSPQEELDLAKAAFNDFWENVNPLHMESWGKFLQELGPGVIPRVGTDISSESWRLTFFFGRGKRDIENGQ